MKISPHLLTSLDDVRGILGPPHPSVMVKVSNALDAMASEFVARSPLLVLATADADGGVEASPKGDGPGFVLVESPRTIVIPERKGNRMILGLRNILANPRVAALFLVPGTDETLRVQGRASLTADPVMLERLSARGQPALLAIRVEVESVFFHCAKAFRRSGLWHPETWPPPSRVSFGRQLAPRLGGGDELAERIDAAIEADYRDNL